jgi:Rrf2 family iron-sulfur cluster assembly transcriptional regulator
MLSSASKHALVILQYLAKQELGGFFSVSQIAEETGTPSPYLSKLAKELVLLECIESKRGFGGGVRLSEKGRELSMYDLCQAMKDPVVHQDCVLRNQKCNADAPCSFHDDYIQTRSNLIDFLKNTKVTQTTQSA